MRTIPIAILAAFMLTAGPASAQLPSIFDAVTDAAEVAAEMPDDAAVAGMASGEYSNSWRSSTRSRFSHVLEAAPGRYRLTLNATTNSPGGETVAVYPQTSGGQRGSVRIGFVIATTVGNSEEMFVTIPQPGEGEQLGQLPIIVDVENASGREYSGHYSIALEPAA